MKPVFARPRLAATFTFGLLVCASNAFAGDTAPLEEQLAQLESSWIDASGEAQYQYFVHASAIASRLFEEDRSQADAAAVRLLRQLLSKRVRSVDVGAADLVAQLKVARFVVANRAEKVPLQQEQTEILAALLQRVRKEIKEGYEPKPVYINVAPPSGEGPRIAGMNPNAIASAEDREVYQNAILENQANNLENARQAELRRMNEELSKPILEQLCQQASGGRVPEQVLAQLLDAPGFSSDEKRSLSTAAADAGRIAGR